MPLTATLDHPSISLAPLVRSPQRGLPPVEPGQLWLVEAPEGGFSDTERGLLGTANVILYDRTLAAEVAALLPPGRYAEPAQSPEAAIDRAARFAFDGWSVVYLIDAAGPGLSRASRLRAVADRLRAAWAQRIFPARVFEDSGNRTYRATEIRIGGFAGDVPRGDRVIVLFDAIVGAARAPFPVVANGLAG